MLRQGVDTMIPADDLRGGGDRIGLAEHGVGSAHSQLEQGVGLHQITEINQPGHLAAI